MPKVIRIKKPRTKKNTPVISRRRLENLALAVKNEGFKIILLLICIASVTAGSLIYRFSPNSEINSFFNEKLVMLQNSAYYGIFVFLIKTDFLFLLISFLAGGCCFGAFLTPISPALKCLTLGYLGSYMYNCFELKGVLFCLLFIYPYAVVTTASLIFASNESLYMSNGILKAVTNKNTTDGIELRLYFLRYLFLAVINCACGAVNAGLIFLGAEKISLF